MMAAHWWLCIRVGLEFGKWLRIGALVGLVSLSMAAPFVLRDGSSVGDRVARASGPRAPFGLAPSVLLGAKHRKAIGPEAQKVPARTLDLDHRVVAQLQPDGFVFVANGGESIGLWSTGVALRQVVAGARGYVSESPVGPMSVMARSASVEMSQRVERRLGVRVWRWRLATPLRARVSADGSVGLFDRRTHLMAGLVIRPVRVLGERGRDVTPKGRRWRIVTHGGDQFLELRLNDAELPVPYTIDPIAARANASNVGSSGMTVTVPSTVETGDLIVVHAAVVGGTGVSSISPSISGGGGSFTVLNSQNSAGTALAQETFWKRAAASDAGATLTLTWSPTANAGAAEVIVEKGVATGGTIPQGSSAGATTSTSNSKVVTCPAIASSAFPQNNLGLCLGAIAVGNTWPSTASPWSNITSKVNGSSLSIGSYSDLCATSGGCSVSATSVTTVGSNAHGELGNDLDVPPDTTNPSADTITLNKGTNPAVQYFNAATGTYYFGVIPSSTTFTFTAAPTDSGSGVDAVAFPNLSGTSGWSGDTGGTVNYQSSGNYTSPTYTIAPSPSTPAAANITATDNNSNSLNTSIGFVHDTTAPPTPSAPTLTGGYYTTASVSVTGSDTTDSSSGTNAAASTMLRSSATLNHDGTCGSFGSFSPISGWTSATAHADTSVSSGQCYEYEWQDADNVGNTATSLPSVIAKVATSGPTFSSATANGNTLSLAYSDSLNLASTPPAVSAYSVHVNNGPALTPSSVSISADTVTLTLASAVSDGDILTVSYTVPATNRVQDLAGNTASNLSSRVVSNSTNSISLAVSARTVVGATLTLGFNEPLEGGQTPQAGDFSVLVNGNPRSVSTVPTTTDGATELSIVLASQVATGDSVSVKYTQNATSAHQIKDRAGLDVLPSDGTAQTVTNNTTIISQDSPSGYWRAGEQNGTTFADSSGNGNTLTLTPATSPNGAQGSSGVSGDLGPDDGAYQFNFDNANLTQATNFPDTDANGLLLAPQMEATMSSGYPSGTNSFSLEAWVKPTAESSSALAFPEQIIGNFWEDGCPPGVGGANPPDHVGTRLFYLQTQGTSKGVFVFERSLGNCVQTPSRTYSVPVAAGQWYYLAATYDGQTMRLYVDGTLVTQQPTSTFSIGTDSRDQQIRIGNDASAGAGGNGAHFKGAIDDPAVYSYALSSSQVQSHYAHGLSSGQSYNNPPSIPANPAPVSLPALPSNEYASCGGTMSPTEWQPDNFSVDNYRYYVDAGYVLAESGSTSLVGSGAGIVDNTTPYDPFFSGWQPILDTGLSSEPVQNTGLDGAYIHYYLAGSPTCAFSTAPDPILVSLAWVFGPAFLASMPSSYWQGGSNAAAPGLCACGQAPGDPVDSVNGDYSDTYTDAKVASYGPPLSFRRTYDASMAQAQASAGMPGPLGYGWTDNWSMSLSVNSGTVTINQADGAVVTFKTPSGGACTAPYVGSGASGTYCALPAVTASLTFDSANSTYTFTTHPYQSYTFNNSGQLTSEAGPGGATLNLSYNTPAPGAGNCPSSAASCMTVTSASGRTLVVASNSSGRVTSVTDPLGRSWTYTYCTPPSSTCSSGDLVSVTDPRTKVTTFTYDQGNSNSTLTHDLLKVTKPNGQPGGADAGDSLVNAYNSSGQVTSQTDPAGNQTTFNYSNLDSSGTGFTLVTDPDGNQTQYTYNNRILVARTLGYGTSSPSTWLYRPDASTLQDDTVIDPNGNETDSVYNSRGDLISKTNALGSVWSYKYNSFDQQTCATQPLAANQCSSLSPPAAIPAGSSTISPPASAPPKYVTYSEYDTNGNPIWTTSGDYNPGSSSASQSRTSYQLYNGQTVTLGSSNDSCTTSAPNSSLPCASINPDAVVTQLGYDSSGDLNSSATPDGNSGGELATTTYGYDGDGELASITAPDGNLSGANAATYTTTYTYNADGQLHIKTVSQTGGGITARTTTYEYDDNGNQISVTDPRTKETDYKYTADDQLTLVIDPDNQQTLTCYDGDGQVAETVPAVGVAANSLTPASCPTSYPSGYGDRLASDATTYSYDTLGDRTTITTPAPAGQSGHETTTNAYDPGGRLTSTTAPPASNDTGAPNQVTTYSYDNADELTTVTKGSGTSSASTTTYCYDPNGEKTATVPPDGNTSGIPGCAISAPYQTTSAYQTGYSYDSLGELVSETRPATTAAPSGQTTSYTYDPAGNQLTSQDPNSVTTTNTYTPLNQLASISYSGSTGHAVNYGYDASGNRVSMSDASGSSSYQYDPFNELTSSQNGASQTLTYTYNPDGQTSGITYPLGSGATWATSDTISYGYDNADELNSITDFNGNTITIGNTADGLPNSLGLGSTGDTISTTYDATDTPSDVSLRNSTSTLLDLAYSNDPSGGISSETTTPTTSTSPAAYNYDPQNRVTQQTPGSGSTLNYSFDASGNLTTLPTGANGNYDNASELTNSTLSSTTTNYTYDSDGQRLQASQGGSTIISAGYNGAQELTSYNNNAANMTSATYDGDGLRISTTTTPTGGSASTQNYLWDTSGSTPQLAMDSTNAYIYGPGTAPIEQVKLSDGTITYLVADRLGSIRGTVNTSGSLTHTTSYDAWGNPQTTGGLSTSTPFGYAGNYTDPTGLTYNIHRYYDAQTGQFISVDPLVAQTEQPYEYAGDEPVDLADPSGQWLGIDTGLGAAIGAVVGGVAGAGSYVVGAATGQYGFSWSGLGIATVSGAVGGAVAGACVGTTWVGGAFCGAAGGFAATATSNLLTGAPLQCNLFEGTAFGAVGGVLGQRFFQLRGFRPYRLFNLWNPGVNAARLYGQAATSAFVGSVPALAGGGHP